jgi:hypothetical protein
MPHGCRADRAATGTTGGLDGGTTPEWTETRTWDPTGNLAGIDHTNHATSTTVTDDLAWDPTGSITQVRRWTHDDGTNTYDHELWASPRPADGGYEAFG